MIGLAVLGVVSLGVVACGWWSRPQVPQRPISRRSIEQLDARLNSEQVESFHRYRRAGSVGGER